MRRSWATRVLLLGLLFATPSCVRRCGKQTPAPGPHAALLARIQAIEWRRADDEGWLLEQLNHEDGRVRARAALAVGRMGHRGGLEPLVVALGDRDSRVREAAAFSVRLWVLDVALPGKQNSARIFARRAVRRAIEHEWRRRVRRALLVTLGWIGDSDDATLLAPVLGGPDGVAAVTAWGLLAYRGELSLREAAALLPALANDRPELRLLAGWALYQQRIGKMRARSPADGLAGCRGRSIVDRLAHDEALAAGPAPWPPDVVRALRHRAAKDEDARVRRWAVRALGPGRRGGHAPLLVRLAGDPDPRIQAEAMRALAGGDLWSAVKLTGAIKRQWRRVSASHFRLVGPEQRPVLVGLRALSRRAGVATVQQFADDMLESANASESAVPYTPAEGHSIDVVHCAAAQLRDLGAGRPDHAPTCGTSRVGGLDAAWRRLQVVETVGAMTGEPSWKVTLLRRYLVARRGVVRAAAVKQLGGVASPVIAPALERALGDKRSSVFRAACLAVSSQAARLRGRGLERVILGRLHELDPRAAPSASCAAIEAVAALRAKRGVATLQRLEEGAAWSVRRCARAAVRALVAAEKAAEPSAGASLPASDWVKERALPRGAVMVTSEGEVTLELFAEEAPAAVAAFARLARRQAYRGRRVRRAASEDVLEIVAPVAHVRGDTLPTIPCELSARPYDRGSVAMVIAGRDTARGGLLFGLDRMPQLDGRVTQLARVVGGMDVLERLQPGQRVTDLYLKDEGAGGSVPR